MHKTLSKIENALIFSAIASSLAMVCLTTADVGARYLLNWSIIGVYEITEKYFMVVSFFFAACYAYREGANIRVTFMVRCLPRRVKLYVDYFVQIISILFGVCLFVAGVMHSLRGIDDSFILGKYSIPLLPAFMIVPVGLFFMTLRMLLDLWRVKKGESGLFVGEQEDTTLPLNTSTKNERGII